MIYYGTEIPNLEKTRALRETFIVLQDYHPLCRSDLLERFFPSCRRFLYWNPSRIAANDPDLKRYHVPLRDTPTDAGGLRMIDLDHPDGRAYAIRTALERLAFSGVDGLFVDDLDSWADSPLSREVILSLFHSLERERPHAFRLFINRGFPFWRNLPQLEAVLLESISEREIIEASEPDFIWLRDFVGPCLDALTEHTPPVAVFALTYRESTEEPTAPPPAPERLRLAGRFQSRVTRTLRLTPRLDRWPEKCL